MITLEGARVKAEKEFCEISIKVEEERDDAYVFFPDDESPDVDALVVYKATGELVSFTTYNINKAMGR